MGAPTYVSDDLGTDNDTLGVVLNGEKVLASEGWESTECVLSQPSNWWIKFGWSDVAAGLIQKYPKGTPFNLFVGTNKQATGKSDGVECDQPAGGASSVRLHGRDLLAKLVDTSVKAQVPVAVGTYADLVWYALQAVKLVPSGARDPNILKSDNVANLQIKGGVPIQQILPHRTVQEIIDDVGSVAGANAGTVSTTPQAKVGETWMRFVRRHIDRAGLMLWAAADGTFVLAAPNGNQAPSYQLVRRAGDPNATGNIVGCHFKDDATGRHTECVIYGRGGGKALGRVKAKGGIVDQEMIDSGYGDQPLVFRDRNVRTSTEAQFLAHRKLAEERRRGYEVSYTISGLTLPYLPSGGNDRAVVVVDTVVAVLDEHLGLEGNFYVETVTRRRSPETSTTLRLMRTADLIFGEIGNGEEEAA